MLHIWSASYRKYRVRDVPHIWLKNSTRVNWEIQRIWRRTIPYRGGGYRLSDLGGTGCRGWESYRSQGGRSYLVWEISHTWRGRSSSWCGGFHVQSDDVTSAAAAETNVKTKKPRRGWEWLQQSEALSVARQMDFNWHRIFPGNGARWGWKPQTLAKGFPNALCYKTNCN